MTRLVRDIQAEAIAAERERCAKIAESYWRNVEETKAAHHRHSPKPFLLSDFGFSPDLTMWSMQAGQRIRNPEQQ